jgi:hypothetical protein
MKKREIEIEMYWDLGQEKGALKNENDNVGEVFIEKKL